MTKKYALLACLFCIAGCATNTPVDVSASQSQLQTRQIQTRQYDTLDRNLTMRSVIATLQDLGFTLDQADAELGTITATRYHAETMRMTVTVVQRGEQKVSVRANARVGEKAIRNAETYQDFFVVLDKAIFLTSNQID